MELKGVNLFKIFVFCKVVVVLESDDCSFFEIEDFIKILGIGKGIVVVI